MLDAVLVAPVIETPGKGSDDTAARLDFAEEKRPPAIPGEMAALEIGLDFS